MSFCSKCGQPLTEGVAFCTSCGAPVATAEGTPQGESPAETTTTTDEAATEVTPPTPDEAATQVLPTTSPAAATQALPPSALPGAMQTIPVVGPMAATGFGPTPPAQAQPPGPPPGPPPGGYPPPGAPPTAWGAPPPGAGSKKKLYIVLIAIAAAVAVFLILDFTLLHLIFGGAGGFAGKWTPVDGSGGGLIIKDGPKVWIVDQNKEYGPMDAEVKGDTMTWYLNDQTIAAFIGTGNAGDVTQAELDALKKTPFSARLDDKTGHLFVTITAPPELGGETVTTEFERVDEIPKEEPTVEPTETPTVTATPTPTVTVTVSPSPTETTPGSDDLMKDEEVKSNLGTIYGAIQAYFADNASYPNDVDPGGDLDAYLPESSWPLNPFSEDLMVEGSGTGDFDYTMNPDASITVTAHLSDGSDYSLP